MEKGAGISMSEAQVNQKSKANSRQDKSKANSRQDKSKATTRQNKSIANSRQEKSIANSRQNKNKKTCEKPKVEREEHMKHTEDLQGQRGIHQEYIEHEH